jgi:opacity protein-like surface antigen
MQAFGGFVMPETVEMKTTTGKEVPIEPHNGFSAGIVFGRDFGRFRLESEISGRKYNHDTIDLSLVNLSAKEPVSGYTSAVGGLITALLDIPLAEDFVFLLGVGTGVNGATVKLEQNIYKDTLFAYHLLTGFDWDFTERASIRFLYKYFTTAGSKDYNRLDSHNLELGLQVDL